MMFCLCLEDRAELFMKTTKFNLDSVHRRTCIIIAKKNHLQLIYIVILSV